MFLLPAFFYGKQIVSLEHPWDTKIYVHAGQKEKKGSHA